MNEKWTTVIKPKSSWFDLKLNELWKYRDLIVLFVKRDFKTLYKQTILGPLWIIINPLLTTIMHTIVFGGIANISTDGTPQFLFYLVGTMVWGYFSVCLTKTSSTFTENATVFGKVYFPRLVTPISTVLSGLINLGVQFIILILFRIYYSVTGATVRFEWSIILIPLLICELAMLGMGFGIIISSLTTKYRDLTVLVTFGVQLWMYASPVVYPISQIPEQWKSVMLLNPVAPILETFRFSLLGSGEIPWKYLCISFITTIIILFNGIIMFNKVEKTFMDTV